MLRNIISLLILCVIFSNSLTSQVKIDSLKNVLFTAGEIKKIQLMSLIADEYYYAGKYDSSIHYYIASAKLSLKKIDTSYRYTIEGYGNAAYTLNIISKYEEAIKYRKLALKYSLLADDKAEIATAYSGIGSSYTQLGNYDKAVEFFEKALKTDLEASNEEYLSTDYNSLGKIYQLWKKYDSALEYYRKALELDKKFKKEEKIAIRYNSIGMTFRNLKQYDSAIFYLNKALTIDLNLGNEYKTAVRMSNLGNCYTFKKEFEKAADYYLKAIAVFENLKNLYSLGIAYSEYAELMLVQKKFTKAEIYSKKSLKIALKIKHNLIIKDNYKRLAVIYENHKQYKKAFENFRAYSSVNDSLFNEKSMQAINNLEVKYETAKVEAENERLKNEARINKLVLQRRKILVFALISIAGLVIILSFILYSRNRLKSRTNKALSDKNNQLEVLNATKDRFFSIISHDLQNPLSAFKNVTKALNTSIDNIGKEEIRYYISELNSSSIRLYSLLGSLLQWAQTQTRRITCKREKINLSEAVNGAMELFKLNVNEKDLKLISDIDKNIYVNTDDKMLQTILRNLFSNAIKYTPEKGEINISCSSKNGNEEVSIKDTGIGISKQDVEKLFKINEDTKTIGNSREKGSGLGLIICKEMIEKCGGEIFVESELDKGTNVKFTLTKA